MQHRTISSTTLTGRERLAKLQRITGKKAFVRCNTLSNFGSTTRLCSMHRAPLRLPEVHKQTVISNTGSFKMTQLSGDLLSQAGSTPAGSAPHPGMLWIPGGTFRMGSQDFYPEERPVHEVSVDGFWMDCHEVTNEQFSNFVEATSYKTLAERPLNPADFPGAPAANLVPGSMVFHKTSGPVDLRSYFNWWAWVPGTSWRHPQGPRSSIEGLAQ